VFLVKFSPVVDCTNDDGFADMYERWMSSGICPIPRHPESTEGHHRRVAVLEQCGVGAPRYFHVAGSRPDRGRGPAPVGLPEWDHGVHLLPHGRGSAVLGGGR
jgi:hypothetical protein